MGDSPHHLGCNNHTTPDHEWRRNWSSSTVENIDQTCIGDDVINVEIIIDYLIIKILYVNRFLIMHGWNGMDQYL